MSDLRQYLAGCAHKMEIHKVVNCAHEVTAVVAALEGRNNFDAVLFHGVQNNHGVVGKYSVLVNLFARQDSIAAMLSAAGMRAATNVPDVMSLVAWVCTMGA